MWQLNLPFWAYKLNYSACSFDDRFDIAFMTFLLSICAASTRPREYMAFISLGLLYIIF